MRYKPMPATHRHTIRIPRLDGGLNLDDTPSMVGDTQITACKNLWFHRGALRTRPGVCAISGVRGEFNICHPLSDSETMFISYHRDEDGNRLFHACVYHSDQQHTDIGSFYSNRVSLPPDDGPMTAIGCRAPRGVHYDYLFFLGSGEIITYEIATGGWGIVDGYVPHLSADGAPTTEYRPGSPAGTALEDGNLLSRHGICSYTTDGVGTYFYLPAVCKGATLRLSLSLYDPAAGSVITIDPTAARTFTPDAFRLDPTLYKSVTLGYWYNQDSGVFRLYGTAALAVGGTQTVPLPADAHNNLTVTATGFTGYDPTRICRMQISTWFGGDRSGIGGGTRLFLAGNSDSPHLLHWSHVDNPLYFPQNNCAYVGEDEAPITAFGKQSDMLVIFKPHAIYCAEYVAGSDPTAATAPSDSGLPRAYRAYFPISLLHPTLGCDCPATVQLVNNKLMWMNQAGQLLMLIGIDRHSDRNVRDISSQIAGALTAHPIEQRAAATGGAYRGRYLLIIGDTAYVLDCRTTAFNHFGRYASEQNALRAMTFYRWELPYGDIRRTLSAGDTLLLFRQDDKVALQTLALEGTWDSGQPISVSFTTKMYGGEDPARRFSVPQMYLTVSDTDQPIRITYHTDHGDYTDTAALIGNRAVADERRLAPRRLTPAVHRAARFGFTCEGEGPFALADLTIITRTDGVIH